MHRTLLSITALFALLSCSAVIDNHPGDKEDSGADTADRDGDTIRDADEGDGDKDRDGLKNAEDEDSDGDCISDRDEAGDGDLATAPRQSDTDGTPDFLDLDSDNDGIADSKEDLNCNGIVDPGESSAQASDTDEDGASDLVESLAGTDPLDPADNPQAKGHFVFVVPYEGEPIPEKDTLDMGTKIGRSDVVFAMDTTGSMLGEINNLKSSVVELTHAIRDVVPDTGFSVVHYEDFPMEPYGIPYNVPFALDHRVMTTNTEEGLRSIVQKVNELSTLGLGSGLDVPESGWEMLYQIMTGKGLGVQIPTFNPATAFPMSPVAGEEIGTQGGVGFRDGAFPVIVWMTDAPSHDGYFPIAGTATARDALLELITKSARVIGIVSERAAYRDVQRAAQSTGALVPPTAWGVEGARPAGCEVGACCTGRDGRGRSPDQNGVCPLVFDIKDNGEGLGSTVAAAVQAVTEFARLDLAPEFTDDPGDAIDASIFVDHIVANTEGSAPCTGGLVAQDLAPSDGIEETFIDVTSGSTVCFDVVPAKNTTVESTREAQIFHATVSVIGDGVTTLDTRDVYFVVPPEAVQVD